MKTETITIVKLIASEGHILTNGETYGSVIYLAEGSKSEDFYEITREEYEALLATGANNTPMPV